MNFFVHVINDDPHGFRKQEYEGIPNCVTHSLAIFII